MLVEYERLFLLEFPLVKVRISIGVASVIMRCGVNKSGLIDKDS